MRKRYRKLSKGWKLGVALVLLGLLVFLCWYLQGCPCFSREAAFHRALRNAGYNEAPLEATVLWSEVSREDHRTGRVDDNDCLCLGSDGTYAYVTIINGLHSGLLDRDGLAWAAEARGNYSSDEETWSFPMVEGVGFVSAKFTCYYGTQGYSREELTKEMDGFVAVRVPAARIELTLVLEPRTVQNRDGTETRYPGGSFPLRTASIGGNWFRCTFRAACLPLEADDGTLFWRAEGDDPEEWIPEGDPDPAAAKQYFDWVQAFCQGYTPAGHFELTAYNEEDEVIKAVTWVPSETPGR